MAPASRPPTAAPTGTASTEELAGRLRLSATRLARQLRQQSGTGLTPSQLAALHTVGRHGPLTLGTLAEHERIAPPSVTRIVAKLEAQGLLVRRPDDVDRRITLVTTTPAGDEVLEESRHRKDAWLAGRLAELDDDQRERLGAALDVLDALTDGNRA